VITAAVLMVLDSSGSSDSGGSGGSDIVGLLANSPVWLQAVYVIFAGVGTCFTAYAGVLLARHGRDTGGKTKDKGHHDGSDRSRDVVSKTDAIERYLDRSQEELAAVRATNDQLEARVAELAAQLQDARHALERARENEAALQATIATLRGLLMDYTGGRRGPEQ
jgi:hypothetical protein